MPSRSAVPRAPAGWVRVDCHLHTVASGDAVLTLEQLAERAQQTGLDVVCVTDHNVTSAAVTAAERDLGVRIIVGEEIRTPDGDVIGSPVSQPDAGRQPLAVVAAVTEEELAGLRPLEVQVGVVLPGEADAAVDLDVLGGHVEVGF